jgi:FkbM family methyltransferase
MAHVLSKKLSAYWKEIVFTFEASCTWADQLSLLRHTAKFHVWNWLRRTPNTSDAFKVDLRVVGGKDTATLTLRPLAGDLFVLYEVLAFNAYRISPELLPLDDVNVIVDCGANIGITSLYLAARYPNARVFSIEPHPDNFALLVANVAQEPRIIPIQACVTGQPQSVVRLTMDQPAWGNRISTRDCGIEVPAITLAQLFDQYALATINLLKLDIEGAEEQVLANGAFLQRVEHIIIELHGEYGLRSFQHDIAPYGFVAQEPHPPATAMITARKALITELADEELARAMEHQAAQETS